MISVDEVRARILVDLGPTPAETVALAEAWSRVAAASVVARLMQPPADVSAIDGDALRAAEGTLGARLALPVAPDCCHCECSGSISTLPEAGLSVADASVVRTDRVV